MKIIKYESPPQNQPRNNVVDFIHLTHVFICAPNFCGPTMSLWRNFRSIPIKENAHLIYEKCVAIHLAGGCLVS